MLAEVLAIEVNRHVNGFSMHAAFTPGDLVKVVQAYARMQLVDGGCCPQPLIHMQPLIHGDQGGAGVRTDAARGRWVLPQPLTHTLYCLW